MDERVASGIVGQELMAWGDHRTFVELHAKDRKARSMLGA